MRHPHTVRRRDSSSEPPPPGGRAAGLPEDLVEKAGKRLGIAALTYAAVYTLAYAAGRGAPGTWEEWGPIKGIFLGDYIAAGSILLSVALFFVVRYHRFAPALLLDLGLVYEVVAAIGIDIHLALGHWEGIEQVTGLSWVAVWIVFFPLICPSTTWKTLLASLATASTTPVSYALAVAGGAPPLAGAFAAAIVPNYICAGLAVVGARVIYGLGADVSRARRMGSYQLTERLGAGGMGEVWRAEHRMLARPAAIKLIRASGAESEPGRTPESQAHRFEREVQATAQLRSPHTVEVYDYGVTVDRTFYYVMELLDGISLEQLVQQFGPIPPERTVHILRQICHSLAEAHAHGLVHRDIKPANIFVCRYGLEHDFVKVLDFGVVKRAGHVPGRDIRLTEVGAFAGTPAYASPEGALGDGELDGRSDLYGLGCVGFWLLTGSTVFDAATPMLMLVRHVNEPPVAPSSRSEFEVPPELDRVILDCLEKSRDARPATAEILDRRLSEVPFDRPWDTERARRWWEVHLPPLATSGAPDAGAGGAVFPAETSEP